MKTIFALRVLGVLATILMSFQNVATAQCTMSATGGTNTAASDGVYLGQAFTAGCTGSITEVTIDFTTAQAYGVNVTIRSACQGTILGTASSAGNVVAGTNTFTYAGVPVTFGTTYAIEAERTGGGGNVGGMTYNTSNPYSGGDLYDAISPCRVFTGFDFNFSVTVGDPCLLAPPVVATVSPVLTCLTTGYGPTSVTLVATGTGGTGTITGSTMTVSPTTTSTACVTNTYTLTVTDANGCTGTATATVMTRDVRCYGGNGSGPAKVNVCHLTGNGGSHTLCINPNDVANHLAHGDALGACGTTPCCSTGYARMSSAAMITEFRVYPNPTHQSINVDIPYSDDQASVVITDVTGRVVADRQVAANLNEPAVFDIEAMPAGIYIVKMSVAGTTYTDKFTKQ